MQPIEHPWLLSATLNSTVGWVCVTHPRSRHISLPVYPLQQPHAADPQPPVAVTHCHTGSDTCSHSRLTVSHDRATGEIAQPARVSGSVCASIHPVPAHAAVSVCGSARRVPFVSFAFLSATWSPRHAQPRRCSRSGVATLRARERLRVYVVPPCACSRAHVRLSCRRRPLAQVSAELWLRWTLRTAAAGQ